MNKHPWRVLLTYGLQVIQDENPSGVYTLDGARENRHGAKELAKLLNERDRYLKALERLVARSDTLTAADIFNIAEGALKDE